MVEAVTTFVRVAAYKAPWRSFNKGWRSWTILLICFGKSFGEILMKWLHA